MLARVPRISPRAYTVIAIVALVSLVVIVLTGAAVRLTGSGLGCPTWPRCDGKFIQTELSSHAAIEYGNRVFTGIVAVATIAAALSAFLRRPFRRDLALLGVLLPLGVVAQAMLGGLTVLYGLAPGFVMGHFLLSQLCVAAAAALAWRSAHEPGSRPRVSDRWSVIPVRILLVWGGFILFLGTVATGSGPHGGASGTGELVPRLSFWGGETMLRAIDWHGHIAAGFGVFAVIVWFILRRRGANPDVRRAMTAACLLILVQGIVGSVQYRLKLPTELVWVHVMFACLTWVSLLWATAASGTLEPEPEPATTSDGQPAMSVERAGV